MMQFGGTLQERGALAAESLTSTNNAVRLQKRGAHATLRDGPFAEAKEMIGDFFLVDVASRDEALALALAAE